VGDQGGRGGVRQNEWKYSFRVLRDGEIQLYSTTYYLLSSVQKIQTSISGTIWYYL